MTHDMTLYLYNDCYLMFDMCTYMFILDNLYEEIRLDCKKNYLQYLNSCKYVILNLFTTNLNKLNIGY